MMGMPSCHEITQMVTDFEEGALGFGDSLRFRMHIMMCGHCRAYLEQMRMTSKILDAVPQERVPLGEDLKTGLVSSYKEWLAEQEDDGDSPGISPDGP